MALLASGKVDKTQLPKVEILFELVVTMEKLRHQLHHGYGYIIRRAHSARHSDRRAESNVMALLQLHHELGVDFPVQPPPTPRQSGARTTADGYTVFLAADATEATQIHGMKAPLLISRVPRLIWLPIRKLPRILMRWYRLLVISRQSRMGSSTLIFHDLADTPQAQYVLGRALPKYVNQPQV